MYVCHTRCGQTVAAGNESNLNSKLALLYIPTMSGFGVVTPRCAYMLHIANDGRTKKKNLSAAVPSYLFLRPPIDRKNAAQKNKCCAPKSAAAMYVENLLAVCRNLLVQPNLLAPRPHHLN